MKLMIVDDSEVISFRLKELLKEIEHLDIAALAEDGLQAITLFTSVEPDIVILDLMIPKMNGLDVLKNIKSKNHSVIIIILTNYHQSYFRDKCTEFGADYFLDKSADFEKVYQICKSIVHSNNQLKK